MTHTFVHIGDLHLQSTNPRNAARLKALDQIVDEGLQLEHLAAWLLPGDLFHSRASIVDRNDLAERLQRMAGAAPVAICSGNHDLPGELNIFAKLKAKWPVYVQTTPAVLSVPLATGNAAAIAMLPYPSKAALVSAGVQPSEINLAARRALEAILRGFGASLQAARERGEIPIFLAHINIAGAVTSVGQPSIGVESLELDPAHLASLGDCYKGLNHVHRGQAIAGAWYAGSVCRMDWGETEAKSYNVVTFLQYISDGGWRCGVEEWLLEVAPMYHVEASLARDGFTWAVTAGPGGARQEPPASWRGCEVRVRYRFPQSARGVLRDAELLATFAEAARLEVEPIAVPDRQLRAPEVAEARTLADKLRAYAGAAATDNVLAKLARLEHGDPLQLLSDVQNALARIESGEEAQAAA
jgi:hypothetical protein